VISGTMRRGSNMCSKSLLFVVALALGAGTARAELGAKEDSVEADRQAFSLGSKTSTQTQGYTVHQMTRDGLTLWEFVGADGTVFAVGWQGNAHPDLSKLLGNYFSEFSTTLQTTGRSPGRRSKQVTGNNVVVETWKALRVARGLAYLPAALPAGVTGADLGRQIQ